MKRKEHKAELLAKIKADWMARVNKKKVLKDLEGLAVMERVRTEQAEALRRMKEKDTEVTDAQ